MGQAKKRGTFEERVNQAQLRNRVVGGLINKSENPGLKQLVRTHGIQRVAVSLVNTHQLHELQKLAEIQTAQESGPHLITPPGYNDSRRITPARHSPGSRPIGKSMAP